MERNTEIGSQSAERELERLAHEMEEIIERENPAERQELRMFASTLISQPPSSSHETANGDTRVHRSMGIIAGGLMLLLVGAGLFLLLPPIGGVLMFLGFAGALWGLIVDLFRKKDTRQSTF
jgi:hypothetical protein